MKIRDALTTAATLYSYPIPYQDYSPLLDARVLLGWVLELDSAALLSRYSDELPEAPKIRFFELWEKRRAGFPVAYLTGIKEFFGRDFLVDPRVLIPRPDTETLVEAVLKDVINPRAKVLDCCTGSGCIALTLASERPLWEVTATDISIDALDVARENEIRLLETPRVSWISTDLLTGITHKFHAIVANPPYLTETESRTRFQGGWVEPELALVSGEDGLSHIRTLVEQAKSLLLPGGGLYIESASEQIESIQSLLTRAGYADIHSTPDLSGKFRITQGRK